MSAMQRRKGQSGERELSAIIQEHTGWQVKRRVRQHKGDSDLVGVPGWSVESKRHAKATSSDIAIWWNQTTRQAQRTGELPLLCYRLDRDSWRFVWPVAATLAMQCAEQWQGYEWTCEGSVQAWASVAREIAGVKHDDRT